MTSRQRTLIFRSIAITFVGLAAAIALGLSSLPLWLVFVIVAIVVPAELFFGVLPLVRERDRTPGV